MVGYVAKCHTYIPPRGIEYWFGWSEGMLEWTEEDWANVAFSDESKFNLFGSNGRLWCLRRDGDTLPLIFTNKKVKHGGGSVTVWLWSLPEELAN
jgi:hypothetical protein